MTIRQETPDDLSAIDRIHTDAFGPAEGPEIVRLVAALRDDPTARPMLSLVAESEAGVVGHILFTAVGMDPVVPELSARILAPLAVAPRHQRRGWGGALIRDGLARLADAGVDLVFVLGDPGYYRKHGFEPAGLLGLEPPHAVPSEHADAWMVQPLREGGIGSVKGRVRCAAALDRPEYW